LSISSLGKARVEFFFMVYVGLREIENYLLRNGKERFFSFFFQGFQREIWKEDPKESLF